ncbi:MAG: M24 family metallopeptidase [Bdellovibrionia bacterium]
MNEIETKLKMIRTFLEQSPCAAVRLRGVDWFSWCTGGGTNRMLLSAETGVAEVLVTEKEAWILTDIIEADRLRNEQIPAGFEIWIGPWQDSDKREKFVSELSGRALVASDRPVAHERALGNDLIRAKRRLLPEEIERFKQLGRDAAEAMTEALSLAQPNWSEFELAGQASLALQKRGIDPALVQVGGSERINAYRHLLPTDKKIGNRAMMAFCARRHGLYASLTRYVFFDKPTLSQRRSFEDVAQIECVTLNASRPGAALDQIYHQLTSAYTQHAYQSEINKHHQGGTTGYLAREVIAQPSSKELIEANTAIAWNPSLVGAKIEDTFLSTDQGLELLTLDSNWPTIEVDGRKRPDIWVRT